MKKKLEENRICLWSWGSCDEGMIQSWRRAGLVVDYVDVDVTKTCDGESFWHSCLAYATREIFTLTWQMFLSTGKQFLILTYVQNFCFLKLIR